MNNTTTIWNTSLLCTTALIANSTDATAANPQSDKRPNIVIVMADDMGWSDIGYHGGAGHFYETPNLDSLSLHGMRLESFYPGGSNSAPSRSCIMTGMYNTRTKIYTPGGMAKGPVEFMRFLVPHKSDKRSIHTLDTRTQLDSSVISLAEQVKQAGYSSARIGKWHLGPDNQGFDESTADGIDPSQKTYYNDPYATDRITEAAIHFINSHCDHPFFLYVPFYDVHTPMVAKPELIKKYKQKWQKWEHKESYIHPVYAARVEQVDRGFRAIYQAIQKAGIANNTLIIFLSDNGGVGSITDNAPLRGCKGNLYEGGIRTPAFAIWPSVIHARATCNTPISGLDFLPTFAELSSTPLPKSQPVDGVSILPLLKQKRMKNRTLIWHYPLYLNANVAHGHSEKCFPVYGTDRLFWRGVPSSAILKNGWKLIIFYESETCELYNLHEDLSEEHDLSTQYPKLTKKLLKLLKKELKKADADIPMQYNPAFNNDYSLYQSKQSTLKPHHKHHSKLKNK